MGNPTSHERDDPATATRDGDANNIRDLVEVSYPPGGRSAEHRHPGFIVGYVLEGQIRFAINHETPRVLRRGEMFYEPTGALHSTFENAQPGMPAKILAFMVAPPGRPVVEGK
jgi:quercetin dioxygenase-like cupin family protein